MCNFFRLFGLVYLLCFTAATGAAQPAIPFLSSGSSTRGAGLNINPQAITALSHTTGTINLSGVPLVTGASSDFTLQPIRVFAEDLQVVAIESNGTTSPVNVQPARGWYGIDPRHPESAMFISVNHDSRLRAMIVGDEQTSVTVIRPSRSGTGDYAIAPNNLPKIPFCGEDPDLPLAQPTTPLSAASLTREPRSTTLFDFNLALDIGHDLYLKLGQDDELIVDYLFDLIGAMNIIYRRDLQVNWVVSGLHIWRTPDPFAAQHSSDPSPQFTSSDQLYNYGDYVQANRSGSSFAVSHLLDSKPGFGGLAYVRVLNGNVSPRQRIGVSNVLGTGLFPDDINTYYWDTMVITHEIGHNVGSPHTHCYSPPIDCCATESCSTCDSPAPALGSLMSYCHQWFGKGGGMVMAFHVRCIELMRPLIENSPYRSVHLQAPAMQVHGKGDVYIPPGSTAQTASTFNSISQGDPSVDMTFTISSTGDLPLVLTGSPPVTITGSPNFAIRFQPAITELPPGANVTFTVRFTPASVGVVTAQVNIPTNIPAIPNYSFQVAGQVVRPSAPVITTFNGNFPIPEATGNYAGVVLNVTGVPGRVMDVDVRINGNDCASPSHTGLQHPRVGELALALQSPAGTFVELANRPGIDSGAFSLGANFCGTIFDDNPFAPSIQDITTAGAPYTGTFRPLEPLSTFAGEEPNGQWIFFTYDFDPGNTGILHSVSLIIRGEATFTGASEWSLYQ